MLFSCDTFVQEPTQRLQSLLLNDIKALEQQVKLLDSVILQNNAEKIIKAEFVKTRLLYKKIEFATEYFMPSTSRLVNGAPLNEIELEENTINAPGGLQVIEALIYPSIDASNKTQLHQQIKQLQTELKRYHNFEELPLTESQCIDAMRLEVFRIMSLGLSGFDTPLCQTRIAETQACLTALQTYLGCFDAKASPMVLLKKATTHLSGKHYEHFDYLSFIKLYLQPINKALLAWQQTKQIPLINDKRPLRTEAWSYFQPNAFWADYYTFNSDYYSNPAKVQLGKALFNDPILSIDKQRSCASCHQPNNSFTDNLPQAIALNGKSLERNTPTLLYAGLQAKQFADLSVDNLEQQAKTVIHNTEEMNGSLTVALTRIQQNPAYLQLFAKAYTTKQKPTITQIQNALGSYIRSLSPFKSDFDLYMRDEKKEMAQQAKDGFNVFMGKAKCATCHFLPLFNGTVPPNFTQTESEVIGTLAKPNILKIDPDLGRGKFNPHIADWHHAFKTPTIRNIAKTAPYMHNGQYPDLASVIDFYSEGGGAGKGLSIDNQTLSSEKLTLSPSEKRALIAFMESLSDAK